MQIKAFFIMLLSCYILLPIATEASSTNDNRIDVMLKQIEILKTKQQSIVDSSYHSPEMLISPDQIYWNQSSILTWNIKDAKNNSCRLFKNKISGALLEKPIKISSKGTMKLEPPHVRSISYTIECDSSVSKAKIVRKQILNVEISVFYSSKSDSTNVFEIDNSKYSFIPDSPITINGGALETRSPYQIVLVNLAYDGSSDWKTIKKLKKSKKILSSFGTVTDNDFINSEGDWSVTLKGLPVGGYHVFVYDSKFKQIGGGVLMASYAPQY